MRRTISFIVPLILATIATTTNVACTAVPTADVLMNVSMVSEESINDKDYEFLGLVEGKSLMAGVMTQAGIGNATAEAKTEAYKLGATHLVKVFEGTEFYTKVVVKAYRKRQPKPTKA